MLQAFVELGWIGGWALAAMILLAIIQLWRPSRHSSEERFVLCSLVYVVMIQMAHGSLSHSALLFLFLGYAGRIYEDSFYHG
ncbi:hypothetical protein CQ10_37800 [Bradyrhizobium valentinum]|uniref:Uncharacterized protein n=1 Tax=Bradyrhizobium valentinum TaxID=1518501 RepID=A0A0R3K167_9BRAD|nr:hypothetical protein CQ10_37800 [Bradyrhizobium valentinum]KRR12910.1 hypothetical protein CP49_16970 [Bradyrhizobium valentinum]